MPAFLKFLLTPCPAGHIFMNIRQKGRRLQARLIQMEETMDIMMRMAPSFSNFKILKGLNSAGRRRMLQAAERKVYLEDDTIVREGEPGDAVYLVMEGRALVVTESFGKRSTIAELTDGSIFGEMAVLTRMPRSATVVAQTKVEVLKITRENIAKILKDYPEVRKAISDMSIKRSEENMIKMME